MFQQPKPLLPVLKPLLPVLKPLLQSPEALFRDAERMGRLRGLLDGFEAFAPLGLKPILRGMAPLVPQGGTSTPEKFGSK